MAFDVEGARKAGYTDAEIAAHLAGQERFDLAAAKRAGYSDGEVIAKLAAIPAAGAIPGQAGGPAPMDGSRNLGQPAPAVPLTDRLIGAGEAALTAVTGATTGAVGMAGGLVKGVAQSIADGTFGTPQAANMVEQEMARMAQAGTYEPRTATGQEYAGALGEAMQQLIPVAPVAHGMMPPGAAGAARAAVTDAARAVPGAVADAGRTVGKAIAQRLPEAIRPGERPTAGTFGSAGAAGADMAAQRVATAESLPVPIRLTKGEATREQGAQRFEAETAKDATNGAPLRERAVETNQRLAQNLEAMIDGSGAMATSAIETGRAVDGAVRGAAARQKTKYRALYQQAEKAGELEAPVSTAPLVEYLAQNASLNEGNLAGGALGLLQRELVRLGGAEIGSDGALIPKELPLKTIELLRRQMNNAIDASPDNATNMRAGVEIKRLIDEATDGLGGDLYREARRARMRYAQLFDNNNAVSQLMKLKRGTTDRQVALEDVFRKTILNGSREDLHTLRRTLRAAGGEEGRQAWKELQGATAKHLLDEATKGVGTDAAGQPLFSAAKLNAAVQALDRNGRLDYMMGKQGAQTIRDILAIAQITRTTPPGVVNTSNTASVVLAALAEAGTTGALTGLPVPVLSTLKAGAKFVKDRKVQQRVNEALRYAEARGRSQSNLSGASRH